jgi:hypothetical protein
MSPREADSRLTSRGIPRPVRYQGIKSGVVTPCSLVEARRRFVRTFLSRRQHSQLSGADEQLTASQEGPLALASRRGPPMGLVSQVELLWRGV